MITKQEFIDFIETFKQHIDSLDKLYDNKALNMDYISDHIYFAERTILELMLVLFTEDGVDWINWWLYEKGDDNKAYIDDVEIPTETVEDLWNLVEEHRK